MRKTSTLPNAGAETADYPFGSIIDETADVKGTALVEATYSDFIQNLWHFVAAAGVTPNGTKDNVTNGFQLSQAMQDIMCPVGDMKHWPVNANFQPGYVIRDGRALSRTTYAKLFSIIGTNYGVGDGSTTFNIPNDIDLMMVGAGNLYAVGATGGEKDHVLSIDEMPAHTHHTANDSSGSARENRGEVGTGTPNNIGTSSSTGGGQAHNNMPPYRAYVPVIKIAYV